ncbi:hypothetical protein SAMN05421813_106142 [Daejeonella rubra]|uniref:Uncharacterized protein n=1 Tax=Daejeonella rubra TaxID=990371 RepID=A0A1G9QPH4_9SPHI|nr:hypothetical protein SAMN05421813_106142 [Daejeonella rubra]
MLAESENLKKSKTISGSEDLIKRLQCTFITIDYQPFPHCKKWDTIPEFMLFLIDLY